MRTLTETIHHGAYTHTGTISHDGTGSTAAADFQDLIDMSPYYSNLHPDARCDVWADLALTGQATYGWATYTLTESE